MITPELEDDALRAKDVRCSDTHLRVTLRSAQTVTTPLWWYPRLLAATPEQRDIYEIMPLGVHWPEIDEDLSIAGVLKGAGAPRARAPRMQSDE